MATGSPSRRKDFVAIGTSANAPIAMIADDKRKFYATQFHPEVVHTPHGAAILRNFVRNIAGCAGDWTMARLPRRGDREDPPAGRQGPGDLRALRRRRFRRRRGADPRGDRRSAHLHLRRSRAVAARRSRGGRGAVPRPLQHSARACATRPSCFSARLPASSDPEIKRKTIGTLFIDVFETEAKKLGGAEFLAQGTLYPDVIESVSFTGGPSVTIKSHHNVGGLPERMKHEAGRALARIVQGRGPRARPRARPARRFRRPPSVPRPRPRHPHSRARSPAKSSTSCARPTTIYLEEIRSAGLYDDDLAGLRRAACRYAPSASWATAAPTIMSSALRAVTSTDGMTADFYPVRHEVPRPRVATRIINEVQGHQPRGLRRDVASRRGRSSGNDFGPSEGIPQRPGKLHNTLINQIKTVSNVRGLSAGRDRR